MLFQLPEHGFSFQQRPAGAWVGRAWIRRGWDQQRPPCRSAPSLMRWRAAKDSSETGGVGQFQDNPTSEQEAARCGGTTSSLARAVTAVDQGQHVGGFKSPV